MATETKNLTNTAWTELGSTPCRVEHLSGSNVRLYVGTVIPALLATAGSEIGTMRDDEDFPFAGQTVWGRAETGTASVLVNTGTLAGGSGGGGTGTSDATAANQQTMIAALGTDGATPPTTIGTGIRGWLRALFERAGSSLPFRPMTASTVFLSVTTTATPAGTLRVALAGAITAGSATSVRIAVLSDSLAPVSFILTTDNTKTAVLPAPFAADGTGGTRGNITLEPGATETFSLSEAQQTAMAAGILYLSAVVPTDTATLSVTPGIGG